MSASEFEKNRIKHTDAEHALQARAVFDSSVAHLDADTRRRLRDVRDYALKPLAQRQRPAWMLPVGATFATALALVVLWPHASPTPSTPTHVTAANSTVATMPGTHVNAVVAEDTSVDNALADSLPGDGSDGADPELLGNLDFYGWLAKQPVLVHSGG